MNYKNTLFYFVLFIFISCAVKAPNEYDFVAQRKLSETVINTQLIKKNDNFKNYFMGSSYLAMLTDSKLGDALFQVTTGDVFRFYVKENSSTIHTWENFIDKPQRHALDESYSFGLVIGQSMDKIYYYNYHKKGRDFYRYSLGESKSILLTLKDIIVLSVVELTDKEELLVCGVYDNTLGFYIIDLKGNIKRDSKKIHLGYSPNGDPSTFGGKFYRYDNRLFYLFNNKSNIYEFNDKGVFSQEITTIDSFSFKHADNKTYSTRFDGLYQDLIVRDSIILVRTNLINSASNYLIFDRYNSLTAEYIDSVKVGLKEMDFNKFSYPIWTYMDKSGDYHLLFGAKYVSGEFIEYKICF